MLGSEPFSEIVVCPGCSQPGALVWLDKKLLRATNGFHQEKERFDPLGSVVVCDRCDSAMIAKPRG